MLTCRLEGGRLADAPRTSAAFFLSDSAERRGRIADELMPLNADGEQVARLVTADNMSEAAQPDC